MCFGHRLPESPQQACVVGRPPSLRRPWTSFSHQEQGNQPRSLELHRKDPASHSKDTPTGQNGKNRSANENNNLTDVSTANTFLPRHFNYMLFLNVSQSCRKIGRYLDRGNAHRAKDKLELSFLSPHPGAAGAPDLLLSRKYQLAEWREIIESHSSWSSNSVLFNGDNAHG